MFYHLFNTNITSVFLPFDLGECSLFFTQFVFDEIREAPYSSDPTASTVGSRDKVIDKAIDLSPRAELASAVTEAIVPCPRRFGATFAPGGTLVVFSSSLAVIRAQTADAQTMDAQTKHARTADDLIQRARSSSQVTRPSQLASCTVRLRSLGGCIFYRSTSMLMYCYVDRLYIDTDRNIFTHKSGFLFFILVKDLLELLELFNLNRSGEERVRT